MGVGVRACVQCGLSIGETATFCPVCGARFGAEEATASVVADQTVEEPVAQVDGGEDGATDRWDVAQPYEPEAELVVDIGAEPLAADGSELDADMTSEPGRESSPVEAEPEGDEAPPEVEAEPEPSAWERKLAAASVMLEAAAACGDTDTVRAAALYQEAIVGCLEAAEEQAGLEGTDRELLRGFDGLSALLERQGLTEEALGVVDDAASLGLLNGGGGADGDHRDALRQRREGLRRLLFEDSAQL
jgi:hypothetical protein